MRWENFQGKNGIKRGKIREGDKEGNRIKPPNGGWSAQWCMRKNNQNPGRIFTPACKAITLWYSKKDYYDNYFKLTDNFRSTIIIRLFEVIDGRTSVNGSRHLSKMWIRIT